MSFQELQESQDLHCSFRYELGKEAFGLGAFEWDLESNTVLQEYSFSAHTFHGSFEDWLKIISSEDRSQIQSILESALESAGLLKNQNILTFDYRLKLKTGEIHFINVAARFLSDKKLVGICRDVTKEMFAFMNQSTRLNVFQQELEALVYAISHDLRAPLRGIDGWSAALLEDCSDQLDETAKGYLARVRSETKHMSELITDLLKLSRITKSDMKAESLNLSLIAEEISKQFLQETIGRKVQVRIQPEMFIQGDDQFIKMMVTHFFSNSFKFTSKLSEATIDFGKQDQNGVDVYFIKDNGAGFNSATSKKLFGTFQRMHRQNEFPGNGIGLSIIKRSINLHRGRVWAESYIDQGATFFFTLNDND